MKKMINTEHIEGRIYQHDLVVKTVQNNTSANFGKEFISGNIEVAVDEDLLNVIPVHFTYVTEVTSSGKKSPTFSVLKKIIDEGKTVIANGKDEAMKVRINTAIGLNDFYTQNDELVSVKVNEGGFVTLVNEISDEEKARNRWEAEMVITSVNRVEKDEEKNIPEDYLTIRGAIFNFRNDLLPVEFVLRNPAGMKFFEDEVAPTNAKPDFRKVWGYINCETKTTVVEEESAFGEAAVKTYERKVKEWVITGAEKVPLNEFGDEKAITADELTKAMQDRETMLADVKKRRDEYQAQKNNTTSTSAPAAQAAKPATAVKAGSFNF